MIVVGSIDYDIQHVVEFMIDEIGSHMLEVCYGSVTRHNMRWIFCQNLSFIIINHFSNFYPVLM